MKVNKNTLKEALEIVRPGLASKEMLEQSTSFAFSNGRVVTYNDEISISHPVSAIDFEGAIRAEELYLFLGKVKEDEVEMQISENTLIVITGRAKAGIIMESDIRLPLNSIGTKGKWKSLPEDFLENLQFSLISCGRSITEVLLTCVNVRADGLLQSSDSFSALEVQGKALPIPGFLLPSSAAQEVCKLRPTMISASPGWVHFKNAMKTEISCRIFEDRFPPVEQLFFTGGTQITLPKSIENIVDRASIFAKRPHLLDETVTITMKKGSMILDSSSDSGWFKEEVPSRYDGKTLDFTISIQLLKRISAKSVTCTVTESKILFKRDNWRYLAQLRTDSKIASPASEKAKNKK